MSDFAEWRPCRVCGLPVALPKRVHDECQRLERLLVESVTIEELDDLIGDDIDPYQTMMDRAREANERYETQRKPAQS